MIYIKKAFYLFLILVILFAPYYFFSEHKPFALFVWVISIAYFLFIKNRRNKNVSRETLENINEQHTEQ